MDIQIIQVPYDSGHEDARTGKGPGRFVENGLDRFLRKSGHDVEISRIESRIAFSTEIGTAFEVNRRLAGVVGSAVGGSRFPLVLAGNCNSCVGTIAGIGKSRLGIIWFDAHGDFNTPDTTVTGFLDGMGLAMAAGLCWKSLLGTVPGFKPVAGSRIVHVGSRDLDVQERSLLEDADIPLITIDSSGFVDIAGALGPAVTALKSRVDGVYLHIDMDVLDVADAAANHLAVPGGLSSGAAVEAIEFIKKHVKLEACAIASYDPDYDRNDSVLNDGFRLINAICSD